MISWKGSKYLKLLIILPIVAVSNSFAETQNPGIKISKRFPKHRVRSLESDLDHLLNMPKWNPLSDFEKKHLGFESPQNKSVFQWLDDRIGYLIPEESDTFIKMTLVNDYSDYPNSKVFPNDLEDLYFYTNRISQTLMSNYGVSYYLFGKRTSKLIELDLSQHFRSIQKPVPVLSPRIGIVSIHESLFKSHNYISELGRKSADSILRLSYLFHEARHSDGNGKSLGFYHMTCPPGTDYAGKLACDRSSNGAYTIGATFLKKSLEVCTDCNEEEKDSLRIHFFDNKSRVINKKILTPQEVEELNLLENKLDQTAHQLFQAVEEETKSNLENEIQKLLTEIKELKSVEKLKPILLDQTPEVLGLNND